MSPPRSPRRGRRSSGRRATSPPSPKAAVLYARVSSKEQEREGYSIPAQQAALRAYASDKGLSIVEEFTDVETAKRAGRTEFGKMVRFLKKNARTCRVILVEKTDRLYRNLKDYVTLSELDLEIHLVKEGAVLSDDSRSAERFMHRIRVLMAQNYIDNLSEEVSKGMRQKAEEGHWPSAAPIGYLNRREGGRSHIVLDPERAPLIARLFELYDEGGKSAADLARWAAGAGLKGKHGGKIATSVVHTILRNPLYSGRFWWGGEEYEGKDPRIVTRELWERVQERLDGHPYTRPRRRTFAFTGLLTCGHCGSAITAERQKEKYTYYHCARNCRKERFLREEKLSELLGELIRPFRMPPALVEVIATTLRDTRRDIRADVEKRLAETRAKYDRLGRLIDAAYEDKLEGKIDADFFARKRADWEAQRSQLLRDTERLQGAEAGSVDLALSVLELANSAYDKYIRRDDVGRREILEILLSNCTLAAGELTPEWRKPFDLLMDLANGPGIDEIAPSARNLADAHRSKERSPAGSSDGASEWWAILDLNQ